MLTITMAPYHDHGWRSSTSYHGVVAITINAYRGPWVATMGSTGVSLYPWSGTMTDALAWALQGLLYI
jgi:hypothetical protein